ncbi:hypothetical protein B0H16DRAFT_123905 [Mycena metata]|uniref:MYND-type domain-containing protein n=1 Tax=Mycena metata TaxID=1033252 RepID=A0AAD7I6G4_9AGAR|nr:hypothetical protein B0H16DRAFT_123905 [Mycena metata]
MQLFRWLLRDTQAARLIATTPSVYTVVRWAWTQLIREPDDEGFEDCCRYLRYGFRSNACDERVFEELVLGAGRRQDLASVVMLHPKRVVPTPEHNVTGYTGVHLLGIIFLVDKIIAEGWDEPLRGILLSRGIITTLTTPCCALGRSTNEITLVEVKGFLGALIVGMECSPAQPWIVESLRAGLLPAVFACSSRGNEERTEDLLEDLLQNTLPGSTIHHSVLSQRELSLSDVRDFDAKELIVSPTVLRSWREFLLLAEDRLSAMKAYDACSFTCPWTCGDLSCDKLDSNHDFKRCSACRSIYYCSPECQAKDWRRGGHRQTCDALYNRRRRNSHISAKDRAFTRALLNHDCSKQQREIALDELEWMHAHPNEIPYILFDYSEGQLNVSFESHQNAPPEFAAELTRTVDGGNARRLHLMLIFDGDVTLF